MHVLWRLERASVEEVRRALPAAQRGAYTTIQTVLNRLAERRLVRRKRAGNQIFYSAALSEADYYSNSLRDTLSTATDGARHAALAQLIGESGDREEIDALAREVRRRRPSRS